ncbi:hypothetical protein Tco_1474003 [Tanacetum coccineum]
MGLISASSASDSSRSGNDTNADDADIRPIYDEEPMAEVQLTAECNIFAIGQLRHMSNLNKSLLEGRVDQYPETCQVKSPMIDSSPDNQTTEYSKQSLEKVIRLSTTRKVDSEPPHGSNVDIPNIHECKQTLDSMVAEKADISETIVKVDSQMMIQKNDVCSQQFRPQTSMSNDV